MRFEPPKTVEFDKSRVLPSIVKGAKEVRKYLDLKAKDK